VLQDELSTSPDGISICLHLQSTESEISTLLTSICKINKIINTLEGIGSIKDIKIIV
jgi:hypothetical protein